MARRATAYTLTFALIDAANPPTRKTGVTFSGSQAQVSKDGGAFANTTNAPVEIGSTGRYKVDLTASEMDAGEVHLKIEHPSGDPLDRTITTDMDPSGSVVTDAGNTASTFKTDRAESTTDYWKRALCVFTTGGLAGQQALVTGYDGSTKFITLGSALTGAPSAGDRFLLVNK